MTLAGGPAAKLGNRYETLWTVRECIRVLRGDADSIRIEEPGDDKAEFVVKAGKLRERHQVKRSHPNGKWSLAALASDDLLGEIGRAVSGEDDRFVFVSGSHAQELDDLCEAAYGAESAEEFEGEFVKSSKKRRASLDRLLRAWECNLQAAIDRLRRIKVETIGENLLREDVLNRFQAHFLGQHRDLLDVTRALVEDSVHRTLNRDDLIKHLRKRGHRLRRLRNPENARLATQEVTDRYLEAARRQLIRETLVPREASAALLSRLVKTSTDNVVLGRAGAGKTAYIVGITEALQSRGWPVLTFHLDRVEFTSVSTTDRLGQSLNLEESPALVLAAAAEASGCPGVLIVDQLDAVGSASGRSAAAFEIVEAMLSEVRGHRPSVVIHTVVVCRSFDWQNDPRLRRLLPSDSSGRVEVAEFGSNEVKKVLFEADFDVAHFRGRQLELLRLPQNLALFLEAEFDRAHAQDFITAKELFDRYWDVKRPLVATRSAPDHWLEVIETLIDKMTATQQLSIPKENLDRFSASYVTQLASEGVITFDGHRVGFGHESFFDYCFARLFVLREERLVEFLKSSEQHLFRRAQVRQVLAYLRDGDHDRYIRELRTLLEDEGIRPHIKDLAIALLAEVAEPTEEEWQVRVQLVGPALDAMEQGKTNPDKLSDIAWKRLSGSKSWFETNCQRGVVKDWLASGNDARVDVAVEYLGWHGRHSPDRAVELLNPYTSCGGKWPERLRSVARGHYTNRRLFEFALQLIDNGSFDGAQESFGETFFGLDENQSHWFAEALAHWMRRRLNVSRERGELLTGNTLLGDQTYAEMITTAAEAASAAFVDHILPVVLDISDFCASDEMPPRHDTVWVRPFKTDHPSAVEACLSALADALATTARESIDDLRDAISTLRERDTRVANHLLQALYLGGVEHFADEAVGLLCEQPWRFQYDWAQKIVRAVVPRCSAESRKQLEDVVLEYVSPYEKDGFTRVGWRRFLLLSAFSQDLRSPKANAHLKELEQKFGELDGERDGIGPDIVESPIGEREPEKKLHSVDVLKGGADFFGRVEGELFDQAVQMLHRLAIESKSPRQELWRQPANGGTPSYGGDIHTYGINTIRGKAALTIRELILTDAGYLDRFRPTLEQMVCDTSPAVLSCVAGALSAVAFHDPEFALSLFKRMDLSEDRLLATRNLSFFLQDRLHDSFVEVRPIIERMLRSSFPDVCQAGGVLAGLAVLTRKDAAHLADEALVGSSHHRLGLAQVAATYVANPECRGWCEGILPRLFNDDDGEVRREAGSCFRQLKSAALETYRDLIRAFGESRAFQEHPSALFHALEESLERLPGLTCDICAKLAAGPSAERPRLETQTLVKLTFRVYQQHQNDEWTSKALDLIDLLCLNGVPDVAQELEDFER